MPKQRRARIESGVVGAVADVDGDAVPPFAVEWQVVPDGVLRGFTTEDGTTFTAPAPPAPTGDDVNAERNRRILAGKTFTLSNDAVVELIGAETDMRNLQALAFAASLRIGAGDTTTITNFRDNANVIHQFTPPLVVELFSVGSAYISAIYQASWVLKDGASIPADYAADENWPT